MRKKIIFFILLLMTPILAYADSISLVCDTDVVKGTNLKCTLKGNSNNIVTAVSAKVRTGSNISFSSFTPDSVWLGDGEEGKIDLYTAQDIYNNFNIGTLNFNINQVREGINSTIIIDSVFFYDEMGYERSVNPVTKNIRIASSINNLSKLSLSTGNLNPSFNSNTTSYSTTINASSITIDAKAESSYSKITGDVGRVNLNYGNNTFRINVTSESGITKTYTINIIRPNNNNNNNNSNNSNTNSNTNNTNSNTNNNNIKSNNTNLKDIKLSSGNINFDKNITEYKTNVSNNITEIEVIATAEDSKSKVEITGNNNLVVGNNKIEIKVIAEDNSSKIYVINVERKKENYILSSNNYISSLKIKNYDIDFDKNKNNYILKIKSEDKLDIDIKLEDSKSTYNIIGNKDLKDNSIIKINVISEDGKTKTYEITIKSKDRLIKAIFILIIIVLLIINIIRLFIRYRSEKNELENK